MEKIVITGIGIISPLGIGKEEFWKNDQAGLSVTCSSEYMKRLHIKSTVNASIDCDIDTYLNNSQLQYLKNESRFCKLEVIATNEAIKDSKIMSRVSRKRIGIISSSAIGGTPEIQKTYEKLTDNKGKLEYNNVLNVNSKAVLILVDKFLGNILKAEELSQTYLIGHSLGSYFALCSNLNIKGRILIAPFYHLYINNLSFINDDVNSQINKGFGVECSDLIKKEFTSLIRMVPESIKKQEYNIYDHLTLSGKKILKKNTLIIRPLGDLIVSKRQIKQLLSIVPSEKSIIYVPRTGHNIIYESPEVISSIISNYIN